MNNSTDTSNPNLKNSLDENSVEVKATVSYLELIRHIRERVSDAEVFSAGVASRLRDLDESLRKLSAELKKSLQSPLKSTSEEKA